MTPNDINMRFKNNRLHVRLYGKPKLENMKLQMEHILETCVRHHCSKILVNATKVEGFLSLLDRYQMGVHFDKMWDRDIRIAVVVPQNELPEHKFLETVARNRGVLLEMFGDIRQARQWLESNNNVN